MNRLLFASPALLLLGAAASAPLIQPGKWENKVEILDVKMSGGPPGLAEAMRGRPQVVTRCVTAAEASRGPQSAMNADKACRFTRYYAANGRISSELVCTRPTGTTTATAQGSYTPTSYAAVGRVTMTGKVQMTMTTRTSGRRLGGC